MVANENDLSDLCGPVIGRLLFTLVLLSIGTYQLKMQIVGPRILFGMQADYNYFFFFLTR